MAALVAGGNADNDVQDLAIDSVNRPDRPLPSGAIRPATARTAALGFYAMGTACAGQVSWRHGLLALGMVLWLLLYNRRLKALPLWGNLSVACLCALAPVFCEWPAWPKATAAAAAFAFAATLGRELLKDIEDMPGDKKAGLRTAPLLWGETAVFRGVTVLIALVIAALPLAYFLGNRSGLYAAFALLGPLPLLLGVGRDLLGKHPDAGALQRRMKWVMLAGLAAILAGGLANRMSQG